MQWWWWGDDGGYRLRRHMEREREREITNTLVSGRTATFLRSQWQWQVSACISHQLSYCHTNALQLNYHCPHTPTYVQWHLYNIVETFMHHSCNLPTTYVYVFHINSATFLQHPCINFRHYSYNLSTHVQQLLYYCQEVVLQHPSTES